MATITQAYNSDYVGHYESVWREPYTICFIEDPNELCQIPITPKKLWAIKSLQEHYRAIFQATKNPYALLKFFVDHNRTTLLKSRKNAEVSTRASIEAEPPWFPVRTPIVNRFVSIAKERRFSQSPLFQEFYNGLTIDKSAPRKRAAESLQKDLEKRARLTDISDEEDNGDRQLGQGEGDDGYGQGGTRNDDTADGQDDNEVQHQGDDDNSPRTDVVDSGDTEGDEDSEDTEGDDDTQLHAVEETPLPALPESNPTALHPTSLLYSSTIATPRQDVHTSNDNLLKSNRLSVQSVVNTSTTTPPTPQYPPITAPVSQQSCQLPYSTTPRNAQRAGGQKKPQSVAIVHWQIEDFCQSLLFRISKDTETKVTDGQKLLVTLERAGIRFYFKDKLHLVKSLFGEDATEKDLRTSSLKLGGICDYLKEYLKDQPLRLTFDADLDTLPKTDIDSSIEIEFPNKNAFVAIGQAIQKRKKMAAGSK